MSQTKTLFAATALVTLLAMSLGCSEDDWKKACDEAEQVLGQAASVVIKLIELKDIAERAVIAACLVAGESCDEAKQFFDDAGKALDTALDWQKKAVKVVDVLCLDSVEQAFTERQKQEALAILGEIKFWLAGQSP